MLGIAADKGICSWAPAATLLNSWSHSYAGDGAFSAAMVREARSALVEVGHQAILDQVFAAFALEWEARVGRVEEGLALTEDILADISRHGDRWHEAELRRIRGEALSRCAPADPARAEQELRAAIAIAREQGARAFALRAALSLAKLYQSANRPLDAHAVLAPVLEGLSPTPEMHEIAEAQALMERLA